MMSISGIESYLHDFRQYVPEALGYLIEYTHVTTSVIDIVKQEQLQHSDDESIYRLFCSDSPRIEADQPVQLDLPNLGKVNATVISSEHDELVLSCAAKLPSNLSQLRIVFDPTFILEKLLECSMLMLREPSDLMLRFISGELTNIPGQQPGLLTRLSPVQQDAAGGLCANPLSFLWGPPGTGKTRTIGSLALELTKQGRVLAMGPTNSAVDELCSSFDHAGDKGLEIFRAGYSANPIAARYSLESHFKQRYPLQAKRLHKLMKAKQAHASGDTARKLSKSEKQELRDLLMERKDLGTKLIKSASIVVSTLSKFVVDEELVEQRFDTVIVDEASMVALPYALCAAGASRKQLIYGGDPKQLHPITSVGQNEDLVRKWYCRNVYGWMESLLDDAEKRYFRLTEQHRMTPEICTIVSNLTYKGWLRTAPHVPNGHKPVFVDVGSNDCGLGVYKISPVARRNSYFNPVGLKLFEKMILPDPEKPGLLISPFNSQRELYHSFALDICARNKLKLSTLRSKTVHRSQGSEAELVFFDLTLHHPGKASRHPFFSSDDCELLLNVGFSRAKTQLVIIGNYELVVRMATRGHSYWGRLKREIDSGTVEMVSASDVIGSGLSLSHVSIQESVVISGKMDTGKLLGAVPTIGSVEYFGRSNPRISQVKFRLCTHQLPAVAIAGDTVLGASQNGEPIWSITLPRTAKTLKTLIRGESLKRQRGRSVQNGYGPLSCSHCGHTTLTVKSGRFGPYLLCAKCSRNTAITLRHAQLLQDKLQLRCRVCDEVMVAIPSKKGNASAFYGCPNYRSGCKSETVSIIKLKNKVIKPT